MSQVDASLAFPSVLQQDSQVPAKNRFLPQHVPRKGQSPEDVIGQSALQFVPAYEESMTTHNTSHNTSISSHNTSFSVENTSGRRLSRSPTSRSSRRSSPTMTYRNSPPPLGDEAEPAWDAVIEADDTSLKSSSRRKNRSCTTMDGGASLDDSSLEDRKSTASSGFFRRKPKKFGSSSVPATVETKKKKTKKGSPINTSLSSSHHKDTASCVGGGGGGRSSRSPDDTASDFTGGRKGHRIARLAALFSKTGGSSAGNNGATTNATAHKGNSRNSPESTSKKETIDDQTIDSASRYKVGTTRIPQSPSQSHVSSGSSGYAGWPGTQDKRGKTVVESSYDDSSVGPSAFNQRKFEQELNQAADLQQFMNDSFEEDSSAGQASPFKQSRKVPLDQRGSLLGVDGLNNSADDNDNNDDDDANSFGGNPADFHLAAALADVSVSSPIPTPSSKKTTVPADHSSSSHTKKTSGDRSLGTARNSNVPGGRPNEMELPKGARTRSIVSSSAGGGGASSIGGTSASTGISIHNLFPPANRSSKPTALPSFKGDPWDIDSSLPPSSPGTSVSKDSSAYFVADGNNGSNMPVLDPTSRFGLRSNPEGIASVIRRKHSTDNDAAEVQVPTEEALAAKSRQEPGPRAFNAMNVRGYPGFINKTRDVPNLMDDADSDSIASSKATSMFSASLNPHGTSGLPGFTGGPRVRRKKDTDDDSDVFDGLSNVGETLGASGHTPTKKSSGGSVVMLGGGLSTIQTSSEDYENRKTPSDYDQSMTNSDVDQYGFTETPGFHQMMNAGAGMHDPGRRLHNTMNASYNDQVVDDRPRSSIMVPTRPPRSTVGETESEVSALAQSVVTASHFARRQRNDLSVYRIHQSAGKKLVKSYRRLCRLGRPDETIEDLERDEDSRKAFALSEMRSRVMEKDIERRLERQGGTVPVDDLVLTPYHQSCSRIRDAVIVSKAWRDGASPMDVVNAYRMTRRPELTYFVKRPIQRTPDNSVSIMSRSFNNSFTVDSADPFYANYRAYTYEPIEWLDDTDFMQMRCPSLGPRSMRGFEMFTIGDCQSILLKLTNEKCMNIRNELNAATARQIDAEDMMKEEGDAGDGMMTDSEMKYLSAMEEVKTLSKELVIAERAFNLVRERIENLVARYEQLLVRIENESIATASVITYEGEDESYYSEGDYSQYSSSAEEYEREMFQRRAQRAELRAELAAREAVMARQEARKIKEEKQREIEILQQRLAELQSESSYAASEKAHSAKVAGAISAAAKASAQQTRSQEGHAAAGRIGAQPNRPPAPVVNNTDKINGVKQRFRDRMAHRKSAGSVTFGSDVGSGPKMRRPAPNVRSLQRRLVGEEMFQHLDFYERSLNAVKATQ